MKGDKSLLNTLTDPFRSLKKGMESCLSKSRYFKDEKGKFHWFLFWNVIAALAHLGNAIGSYSEASEKGRTNMYPVYQDYSAWRKKDEFCASHNNSDPESGYLRGDFVILPTESGKSQELSLFWLIIGFHLLSFGFQIILNTDRLRSTYVRNVLQNGVNPFRFIEYSISASIMVICLALISNILNLYALIALGCLTAVTQLYGLLAECLFSDEYVERPKVESQPETGLVERASFRLSEVGVQRVENKKVERTKPKQMLAKKLRQLGWVAHFSGWVSMISAYVGILVQQYFWSVSKNKELDASVSPPDWVTVLIIILAILYNIFGFTQLFQLCAKDPLLNSCTGRKVSNVFVSSDGSGDGKYIRCCGSTLNEGVELCYVLNSLVSKSVLGWTIIGQLLREDTVITTTVTC